MREMIYRNLSSPDRRQKDLTLAEFREDQGVTTQLEKRYTYRVKTLRPEAVPAEAVAEATQHPQLPELWELRSNPAKSRHVFVRKSRSSRDGVEDFTYKIVGSFYALHADKVFLVVYRHILHLAISDRLTTP